MQISPRRSSSSFRGCAALMCIFGFAAIGRAQTAATPAPPASAAQTASAATPGATATDTASWKIEAAEHPLVAGSAVRETVWTTTRAPGGTFDRMALHRYRGAQPASATLLYLPGTNMNGIAALTDESHNLWVFLASRGVEVFAIDYRTRFVPPSTPATDLTAMRGWTMETFVGDIGAAAALARQESGRQKLFVAGFSRGVPLAYAYTSADADRIAGLVLLDGGFKSHAPKNAFDAEDARKKLEASNAWASDVAAGIGWDGRDKLMKTVSASPDGPASDAKFKTIGDQLATLLQFAWRPGGLANPLGGMSKPQVLATLLGGYDRYYPAVQDIDGRAIADQDNDPRTALDDRWGKLGPIPIILFVSTGMGGDWLLNSIYSADKSGSTDVTLNVLERYGHVDVLVGEKARQDVYEPTLAWVKAHAAGAATAKPSAQQ